MIYFDREFRQAPHLLFEIVFEVAGKMESPYSATGRGGVDVKPQELKGITSEIKIHIEEIESGHPTNEGWVGEIIIQPLDNGTCARVTLERFDKPRETQDPYPHKIFTIWAKGFKRAQWFEDFKGAFLARTRARSAKVQQPTVLHTKPAGRKTDSLYNNAYKKIPEIGIENAFIWYCEQANIDERGRTKTTRDAFKSAMKRRNAKATK